MKPIQGIELKKLRVNEDQLNILPYSQHVPTFCFCIGVDSKSLRLNVLVGIGCLCHRNGNFPCQNKIDVSLNSSDFAHKPLSRISSIVTVLNSTFACRLILLLYNIIHNHNIYTEMYKTPYRLWSKMYIILQIGIFSFLISSCCVVCLFLHRIVPLLQWSDSWVSNVVGCFLVKYQNNKTHTPTLHSSRPVNQSELCEIERAAFSECA